MNKVENKKNYIQLFNVYKHNIPVIYSSLEGQYDGELYVDSVNNPQMAVLFTPFAFHFVAGDTVVENAVDLLDELIFKQYIVKLEQKEAIVFTPNEQWDRVLGEVFCKHNGLKDLRKTFHLNKHKFLEEAGSVNLQDVKYELFYEKEGGAKTSYPVCRVFKEERCIGYCSGFMLGKGHAEIDVFVEENYRGRGYARVASTILIKELLGKNIEPDWCTWAYRTESQKLAISLGFELFEEVPAHIWVEAECGKL